MKTKTPKSAHTPTPTRFWSKVDVGISCWLWTAYVGQNGYPRFRWKGRSDHAHRVSYELAYGEIPTDKVVDHICRNLRCVRPHHLRLLTRGENVLAGIGASAINKAKTKCPSGHEYDGVKKNGDRFCRTCKSHQQREGWLLRSKQVNAQRRQRYAAIAKAEAK
jgi:hypothetical protein